MADFCQKCGAAVQPDARFCMMCGAVIADAPRPADEQWRQHATPEENSAVQGRRVSPNVFLGNDGKYRWVYEMKILKNGTMLRTLLTLFPKIILIALVPILIIWLIMSGFDIVLSDVLGFVGIWVALLAVFELLVLLIVPLYSAIMGGSYWTIFEMDEKVITQIQMNKTFKRHQALGLIFLLTDDDLADMMTSIRLATQNRYDSAFARMRKIRLARKRDLIDIKGPLLMCPVFAQPEDYDFILQYILAHAPEKAVEKFQAKYRGKGDPTHE